MPDGKRKRRHSQVTSKRVWYAQHRARRFARRLGFSEGPALECRTGRLAILR